MVEWWWWKYIYLIMHVQNARGCMIRLKFYAVDVGAGKQGSYCVTIYDVYIMFYLLSQLGWTPAALLAEVQPCMSLNTYAMQITMTSDVLISWGCCNAYSMRRVCRIDGLTEVEAAWSWEFVIFYEIIVSIQCGWNLTDCGNKETSEALLVQDLSL